MMRGDHEQNGHHTMAAKKLTILYMDLQRVQDKNTVKDRKITLLTLGIGDENIEEDNKVQQNGTIPEQTNGIKASERRQSMISHNESLNGDDFDEDGKSIRTKSVRYQRLDNRMAFANALVAANPTDIIVIDSWPEECLMRSSFPALDYQGDEYDYAIKTSYRPNGGRGTMIAIKKRYLVPEGDKQNVGLVSLERLVKRNWHANSMNQGGCNQSWVHAVDAGPSTVNAYNTRLAIVSYDCGKGYKFQNELDEARANAKTAKASLFTSKLFLNRRSSSFSNNLGETTAMPLLPEIRPAPIPEAKTTALLRASRSSSTVQRRLMWRNGQQQQHSLQDGQSTEVKSKQAAMTPMEEAEERIRLAGELKQLKSFLSVNLANQIGDKRRHIERRKSLEVSDIVNMTALNQNGAMALVVGKFGINSLPLAQSMASCGSPTMMMASQECQVFVCDNDRDETMALLWWRPKSKISHNESVPHTSSTEDLEYREERTGEPVGINDSTSTLLYDRNEWLNAEFESRPRKYSVTFQ